MTTDIDQAVETLRRSIKSAGWSIMGYEQEERALAALETLVSRLKEAEAARDRELRKRVDAAARRIRADVLRALSTPPNQEASVLPETRGCPGKVDGWPCTREPGHDGGIHAPPNQEDE